MSGDSRARNRGITTSINSERAVPANGSASAEEYRTSLNMDPAKPSDQAKASDQAENTALLTSSVSNQQKQKKSSFQITKVITKNKDDVDVVDDLDETNTEDISSGLLDSSKMTDADQEPSSADTLHSPGADDLWPLPSAVSKLPSAVTEPKEKVVDTHSRFKIVKIESKDRTKKGRWTCMDFADPEHTEKSDEQGTGNSSATNSIYYIPGTDDQSKSPFAAAIVYNQGHPVLEPNLLKSPLYVNDGSFQQLQFFPRPYLGAIQSISISDQEILSRLNDQQLPSSGNLPTNLMPAGSLPTGSLPSGTLATGSIPSCSLPAGSLASGHLPAGTLSASNLPSGTQQTGCLPAGTVPVATGAPVQAVPFAHGGLLPTTEILNTAHVAASKPFSQLYTSDAGVTNSGIVPDDHGQVADGHSAFSDAANQRGLAMSSTSKDPTEHMLVASKRTSQTSPLLAMVSATMNSSGFSVIDNDER